MQRQPEQVGRAPAEEEEAAEGERVGADHPLQVLLREAEVALDRCRGRKPGKSARRGIDHIDAERLHVRLEHLHRLLTWLVAGCSADLRLEFDATFRANSIGTLDPTGFIQEGFGLLGVEGVLA